MKRTIGGVITEGIVLPGDLESLDVRVYEEFKAKAIVRELVEIKDDDPPYAKVISYDKLVLIGGEGGAFNPSATGGVRRINTHIVRTAQPVRDFAYSVVLAKDDIEAARALKRDLNSVLANAVAEQLAIDETKLFFNGDASLGIKGINDYASTVSGTTGNWSAAAGKVIIADLRLAVGAIRSKDRLANAPLALVLNPKHIENLSKFLDDTYPMKTVMETIEANKWFEKVSFSEVIGATTAYIFSIDPTHIQLSVVQDVERGDPVSDLMGNVEVAWTEKTAGAVVRYSEVAVKIAGI